MAPLQRLTVKPIEDPAEHAAIEERLKRSEEAVSGDFTAGSGISGIPTDVNSSPSPIAGVGELSESKRSMRTRRSTRKRR
jgi:hypothetical protein